VRSVPRNASTAPPRSFAARRTAGHRRTRRGGRIEHMSADRPNHETATPQEVADARQEARTKLAEAARRHDPAYWESLRARFGVTADPA